MSVQSHSSNTTNHGGYEDIYIEHIADQLDSIKGTVATHSQRKQLYCAAQDRTEHELLNEIRVDSNAPVKPLTLLRTLKHDPHLRGVTFSRGVEACYQSLLHVDLSVDQSGLVTLHGTVPNSSVKEYLEAKLWITPGVTRVVNLSEALNPGQKPGQQTDSASILRQLIDTEPAFDHIPSETVQARSSGHTIRLSGHIESHKLNRKLEDDAWAIPSVQRVDNQVSVGT